MKILQIIKRKELIITGITLVVGMILGAIFFGGPKSVDTHEGHNHVDIHEGHEHEETNVDGETIYTCSMHPQIKQNKPGLCPICAMDLIPLVTVSSDDEDIDPDEIQMTESAMKLADIQTVIVVKGVPEKSVRLLGKVKADERNITQITARFGGRLEKLYVNYTGQNIRKGEKLGVIYSPDLITAQRELLEAARFKNNNPSFYSATRTKLRLWDLTDEQINAIEENGEPITYFEVLAPISGTVTKRHIAHGEYIKEGTLLFEVTDLTSVWLMFEAYESDLPWIKLGDKVNFTLKSYPGKNYNGKISYIDPFIDASTRVTKVRVEMSNPGLSLKPEMFANGIIESSSEGQSSELMIPRSSILWTGKRAVVYVKIQNRKIPSFLYREIVLGPEAGNFYVVADGLHEGEEIATNGVFKIDASAQLAGKPSMMNPEGGKVALAHDHGAMTGGGKAEHSSHQHERDDHNMDVQTKHAEFHVSGLCGMCKDRIESAAMSVEGVISAEWDKETSMIHLTFRNTILSDVHKAIAAVGHDTELEIAPDDVYNDLPGCCLYRD